MAAMRSLHRNNAAEWVMLLCIAPLVLIVRLLVRLSRRFH